MAARKPQGLNPAAALASRRAGVLLFSGDTDLGSHWARFVAAEKDIDGIVVDWVRPDAILDANQDWLLLSPDRVLPTLADREVVLYPARVLIDYLDERYPHPPLLPPEPAARARLRLALHQIETVLYPLVAAGTASTPAANKARRGLREQIAAMSTLFPPRGWFMSSDFTLVDCAWGPLLWRLRSLDTPLESIAGLRPYADRLFGRPGFQRSLSPAERALMA